MTPSPFSQRVVDWQRDHGRHGLPWQATRDAYRIWLSEVMLQQTQVATVLPYYARFLQRFPDVRALAAADDEEVMRLWSGLGYYARARNLLAAAREVASRFGGEFPKRFDDLVTLPGVGRSTAAAIAAFTSGERRAILDANVRRVLARHAAIGGDPGSGPVLAQLWRTAEERMPTASIEAYTQAMMDLGACICLPRNPLCLTCPVSQDCRARLEGRTGELPGKRRRAARRRERVAMLVVLSKGEVLLERRPAKGIWGGLWSLPEAPVEAQPAAILESVWGLVPKTVDPLPVFEHAFTHFTLEVQPWRITLRRAATVAEGREASWLPLGDVAGAALPSPVKRLLQRI